MGRGAIGGGDLGSSEGQEERDMSLRKVKAGEKQ